MSLTFDKVQALYDAMPDGSAKTENKKHLNYLSHIASLANADISRWQILPSFGSGEGDNFLHDKNEINRIFFEKLKKNFNRKKEDAPAFKTSDVPGLDRLIDEYATTGLKQKIATLERSATNYQSEARNYYEHAERQMVEASKFRREAMALKAGEGEMAGKLRRDIIEVLKLECWVNPVVDERLRCIWLNTKNDVVVAHKNKAAGIDAEINAGKLAVQLNLVNFQIRVFPYENNRQLITRDAIYYHPHVDYAGNICWGNAANQVANDLPKGEFGKVLEILYSLLFNYHDHNPFINILAFRDQGGPLDYENQRKWWQNMGYNYSHHPDVPKRLAAEKKAAEEAAKEAAKAKAAEEAKKVLEALPGQPVAAPAPVLAEAPIAEVMRVANQIEERVQQLEQQLGVVRNPDADHYRQLQGDADALLEDDLDEELQEAINDIDQNADDEDDDL